MTIPTARPASKQQKVKLKYTVSDGELYHEDWRILALNACQEMAYEPPAVREKKKKCIKRRWANADIVDQRG